MAVARAPFQVLVIPFFRTSDGVVDFAIFRRRDDGNWQFIAGGGEDGETPLAAAGREACEEAGTSMYSRLFELDSIATIPAHIFKGHESWGGKTYVIPEHCFAVEVRHRTLTISNEHDEYRWTGYEAASKALKWDSNKNALWELNERLKKGDIGQPATDL